MRLYLFFSKMAAILAMNHLWMAMLMAASATQVINHAAGYCVEYYDDPTKYEKGTLDENYYCEIWIPIKKK